MYFSRVSRVGRTILLLAAVSLFIGCDDRTADRDVREQMQRGRALALEGTPEALSEARQVLEQAAVNAEASPATQANAKSLLAQVELEAARAAQRSVDQRMMELSQLRADIIQLAQQIATTNALIAGYRQYDPRPTLQAIEQNIADATGGPDRPAWFTHDDTVIPTLTVLRQDISRLEGEIANLQERLNQLNAQRSQVLSEADQAAREAEGPQNDETLAAFRRASDLRKQAADLATEIDRTQAALVPLRNDLAIAQSQQQVIEGLIHDLQEEAEAQNKGWQMIQQQMAAQTALARAILEGADGGASDPLVPPGGSIRAKATELQRVVQELHSQREQALASARNAADHYGQAVSTAEQLRQDLETRIRDPRNANRPERGSWQALVEVMHPMTFRLHHATAQRTLAGILGTEATEYTMRIEMRNFLAPILEDARLRLPDELQAPNLERDREQALAAANEAYSGADGLLEKITEGVAPQELQNAAYVARILTLYGWSQLSRNTGDQQTAQAQLEQARQVMRVAQDRNIALPAMPEGLGGVEPAMAAPARPAAETTPPDADEPDQPVDPADAMPDEPTAPAEPTEPDPDTPTEPEPDTPVEPEPTDPGAEPEPEPEPDPDPDPGNTADQPG